MANHSEQSELLPLERRVILRVNAETSLGVKSRAYKRIPAALRIRQLQVRQTSGNGFSQLASNPQIPAPRTSRPRWLQLSLQRLRR